MTAIRAVRTAVEPTEKLKIKEMCDSRRLKQLTMTAGKISCC